MDQRIKNIKISLNELLDEFQFPGFARSTTLIKGCFATDSEAEENVFRDKVFAFEKKFKNAAEREKLLFSSEKFERSLISQLATDICVWTASKGSTILRKYYSGIVTRELSEKVTEAAFEFYYETDEDENEYEGKLFLLWHIVMTEKLPETVLVKLEEFIEI